MSKPKQVEIWQKPSCTSCRKAVAHLESHGVEMNKHDLAKERPPRALLERLVDANDLGAFVNTRSRAYKERGLDLTKMTKKQAIDLVLQEPNLMHRPLVLRDGDAVFGLDFDALDELTGELTSR